MLIHICIYVVSLMTLQWLDVMPYLRDFRHNHKISDTLDKRFYHYFMSALVSCFSCLAKSLQCMCNNGMDEIVRG
jgi:hypothetical protein